MKIADFRAVRMRGDDIIGAIFSKREQGARGFPQ